MINSRLIHFNANVFIHWLLLCLITPLYSLLNPMSMWPPYKAWLHIIMAITESPAAPWPPHYTCMSFTDQHTHSDSLSVRTSLMIFYKGSKTHWLWMVEGSKERRNKRRLKEWEMPRKPGTYSLQGHSRQSNHSSTFSWPYGFLFSSTQCSSWCGCAHTV